jgi:hypothetical protein
VAANRFELLTKGLFSFSFDLSETIVLIQEKVKRDVDTINKMENNRFSNLFCRSDFFKHKAFLSG